MDLNQGFLYFKVRTNRVAGNKSSRLIRAVLGTILPALMVSSCATPHATLDFSAPPNVVAGTPFTITVAVLYQGKPDTVISSHITFTSSDPSAVLPGDYTFTPSDAGLHTWTNGFVLVTPGAQTISGSIWGSTGINGTAKITVSP